MVLSLKSKHKLLFFWTVPDFMNLNITSFQTEKTVRGKKYNYITNIKLYTLNVYIVYLSIIPQRSKKKKQKTNKQKKNQKKQGVSLCTIFLVYSKWQYFMYFYYYFMACIIFSIIWIPGFFYCHSMLFCICFIWLKFICFNGFTTLVRTFNISFVA